MAVSQNTRINTLIMRGMSATEATAQALAEEYIETAHAMPAGSNWHIASNADGGAGAEDFMRKYAAKNADAILARRAENGR